MNIFHGLQLLLLSSLIRNARSTNLRRRRKLNSPYFTLTTSTLGSVNFNAAVGNPMKGLVDSPRYTIPRTTSPFYDSKIPLSLEFYYIGLDEIMLGDPDVVGEQNAFNWKVLDDLLEESASRNMHAMLRFICHFPFDSKNPLKVPKYLIKAGLDLKSYSGLDNGVGPDYSDPLLLNALQQFITRFGRRYDGDKRIAFIQTGLLGYWGEWHDLGNGTIPDSTKEKVLDWYALSFNKTKIQTRYPSSKARRNEFGLHDDSFAKQTLDGNANGGRKMGFYFWPSVVEKGMQNSWKVAPIGGETSAGLQSSIFGEGYLAGKFERQDFMLCVNRTHSTYIFHHAAFKDGGFSGSELAKALRAHASMGYNFHVPQISTQSRSDGKVDIHVTLTQVGVAPFYYPLSLSLNLKNCKARKKISISGANLLADQGKSKVFVFTGIRATSACLGDVSLSLESRYLYPGRPIKFAQGNGTLKFSLPLP